MKRIFKTAIVTLMVLCLSLMKSTPSFAEDFFHNTLMDNAYVLDLETLTEYYVGYSFCTNDSEDWDIYLAEEETGNSTLGRSYIGSTKIGNTLSADINCTTPGARLGIAFEARNEAGEVLSEASVTNEESGSDDISLDFLVPEDSYIVAILALEYPAEGGYSSPGTFGTMAELLVNGRVDSETVPIVTNEDTDTPDAPVSDDSTTDDSKLPVTDDTDSEDISSYDDSSSYEDTYDAPSDTKKSFPSSAPIFGGAGVLTVFISLYAIKAGKAKKPNVSGPSSEGEETYVHKDAATGAETLYIKDGNTGEWVSQDGTSVLDPDKISEWNRQRASDRAWQDEANKGVEKPTRFEDIDKKQAAEEALIERETYIEKIAIKHGADVNDMDAVYEKVAHDQGLDEVKAQEWMDIADKNDTGLKIAENLKTTADYSVSALGAVTGSAGTVVKDLYSAGTTIGGDVSQAIADGKDGYEIAQTVSGAVTKTAVSVIQNHATGVFGKAGADIAGGAVTGGIDAYVNGKDVGQGIATGTASGILSAGIDAGGEMASALKDSTMADGLKKDLVSELSDVTGDFLKSESDDAISKSFEKTFNDLKPKNK